MEGLILEVARWEVSKGVSLSVFLMLTMTWRIFILFRKLALQIADWTSKTFSADCSEVGDVTQSPFFFQYLYCWLVLWCLDYRALLDFLSYGSDSAHYASKVGNFMQTQSFLISLVMTCTWCLDYRVLLNVHSYESDSWRMYTLKIVCLCAEGELGSYFSLGEG